LGTLKNETEGNNRKEAPSTVKVRKGAPPVAGRPTEWGVVLKRRDILGKGKVWKFRGKNGKGQRAAALG